MGRSTVIAIGIISTLLVFVFLVSYTDSYYVQTTLFIKPNNNVIAAQADHVINNIAAIPQRDIFSQKLISTLSEVTVDQWNEQIRTRREPATGYVTMNVRGASFDQAEAISIAASRLWIEQIANYYTINDEVDVRIVDQELQRGSWREFTLTIIFSLLIGLLISLVLHLVSNTLAIFKKRPIQKKPEVKSTQQEKPRIQKTPEIYSANDQDITIAPKDGSQPTFIAPTFSKRSGLVNTSGTVTSDQEENARIRLHHARAQERNLIAATKKELTENPKNAEQIDDVFDHYNREHALGAEGIGKDTITDTAPENLPVVEIPISFGDLSQLSTKTPREKQKELTKKKQISLKDSPSQESIQTTSGTLIEHKQQSAEPKTNEKIIDKRTASSSGQVSGAPMNLPIVGVTGKTTASALQEDVKAMEFTPPKVTSEKKQVVKKEPIDLDREPTDEELKDRLNQLLQGHFKTK